MKKFVLAFCLFLLGISILFSQEGWFWKNATLSDVDFVDQNSGWVVGMSGLIMNTTDGGMNWTKQQSGTTEWLQSAFFINSDNGFVVGSNGIILKTTDRGANWTQQYSGTGDALHDVFFVDVDHGIAVGSNDVILQTTNGGADWIKRSSGFSSDFQAIFMLGTNNGYAVGNWGAIIKTNDGGITWTVQLSGAYEFFYDVYFIDANTGFVIGSEGIVRKTTNGGINWTLQSTGNTNSYTSIDFADRYNGVIIGNGGTVLRTTNGGLNWNIQIIDQDLFFRSVCLKNTVNGVIVGSPGLILTTTDAGTTWIRQTNGVTAPDLLGPKNNSTNVPTSITFQWYDITLNADYYQLQIAKDYLFNILVYDKDTILNEQQEVSGLPESSLLFWRVRSNVFGSFRDWSNIWSFSTSGKTPRLIRPVNNSVLDPSNISLQWSSAAGSTQFRLQLSTDSLFISNIIDEDNINGNSKIISVDYGTRYFWRVGAKNVDGQIYWSSSWNFTTFEYPEVSFPLEIGNKWYYQAGSNGNECYGIIKEVTDTLSNGFREITCKNLFRTGASITKEYWGFINGKFYLGSSPEIQPSTILYNYFLTHDSCNYDNQCWKLIQYNLWGYALLATNDYICDIWNTQRI